MKLSFFHLSAALMLSMSLAMDISAMQIPQLAEINGISQDNKETSLAALAPQGKWLLIVVSPHDPHSARVLQSFGQWENFPWIDKTVLVFQNPPEEIEPFLQQYRTASDGRVKWFSTVRPQALLSLQLGGTPTFFGMEGGVEIWRIAGLLDGMSTLEPRLRDWLK